MRTALRFAGVITLFGCVAPPMGLAVFIGVTSGLSGRWPGPIHWREFPDAVIELGLPAAAAGALFSAVFYWLAGARPRMASALGMSSLTSSALLSVFGLPFLRNLVMNQRFSPTLALVALIAGLTGLLLGLAIPKALPARRSTRAG